MAKHTRTVQELKAGIITPQSLAEIEKAFAQIKKAKDLLERCVPQVGMYFGEEIQELLAEIKSEKFNSKEYHFERLPNGQ